MMATPTDELRAIAEAATPGPWSWTGQPRQLSVVQLVGKNSTIFRDAVWWNGREADMAFIATFDPPTMIAFFDERDALLDRLAALEAERAAGEARVVELEREARRFADCYPESSDGRNTFVIFADKIAALAEGGNQ